MLVKEGSVISFCKNKNIQKNGQPKLLPFFKEEEIQAVLTFLKSNESYHVTPLLNQQYLAHELGLAHLMVKDESYRFGLNAFKVTGGMFAVAQIIAGILKKDLGTLSFDYLRSGEVQHYLKGLTFISATDGNHGKGIAWMANQLNIPCIIRMPIGSTEERLASIREEKADAEITDMNYDDTVRLCAEMAQEHDYILIQDTAWEGYTDIPKWIMQGYGAIAKEITDSLTVPPTHLFLQAGVGSFAGAIAAYFVNYYGPDCPKIIIVEPDKAACYYRSFQTGKMEFVGGEMRTIMAGLACGEPNIAAYEVLAEYAYGAIETTDDITALGMRVYGNPGGTDARIIAGESGAVTLGALMEICRNGNYRSIRKDMALDEHSRVLLINSEGDTDKNSYKDIVWYGKHPVK